MTPAVLLPLALLGCRLFGAKEGPGQAPDTGDASTDSSEQRDTDADSDADSDSDVDTNLDTDSDSGADTSVDTAPDTGPPLVDVAVDHGWGVTVLGADSSSTSWYGGHLWEDWDTDWSGLTASTYTCALSGGIVYCRTEADTPDTWTEFDPPYSSSVPADWYSDWERVQRFWDYDGVLVGCALTHAGGLYCWDVDGAKEIVESGVSDFSGDNSGPHFVIWIQDGQVRYDSLSHGYETDPRPMLDGEAIDVVAGVHACVVRPDGSVDCDDELYTLDDFGTIPAGPFTSLATPPNHGNVTCGIHTDGTIECWYGYDDDFGSGIPASANTVPEGTYTKVAMSPYLGCALRTDGCVVCWSDYMDLYPETYLGFNPTVDHPLCYSGQELVDHSADP